MTGRLFASGVMLACAAGCAPAASAEVMSWQVDGQSRHGIVYSPVTDPMGPLPVILAFHGYGDDMRNFQHVNLHRAAPDALVVYLQGLPTRANLPGWQVERGQYDDRDLKFVDVALGSLRKAFRIDDARVYATGFSNGGALTYLLWAERPRVFAAYAPVAGRMYGSVQPGQRRPLLHVAGTADALVRFSDQQAAFEAAVRVNGVGAATTSCGDGCTLYGSGTPAPVMVWIHPGAHTYPRGTSERIAAFFRNHSLRR
jgi:polyhydroxybutyrate depolymerase